MAAQLSFLDGGDLLTPAPPHNGSSTSRAAAESILPHISIQEAVVMRYIAGRLDGATREECSLGTGLRLASVCARANRLIAGGLLAERGERRGSSGRMAAVLWIAKSLNNGGPSDS